MKLIFTHKQDDVLTRIKKNDPKAQNMFYEKNAGKFLGVCRRYIKDQYQAEDCLVKAFCKIFKNIESFRNEGSFEGWCRRIVVHECLNYLKTRKTIFYLDETNIMEADEAEEETAEYHFEAQKLMDELEDSYKMVFNLYVMEDYSHQEIAEVLNISVSSSKTQLYRAKQKLKKIYLQQQSTSNESRSI